MLLKIMDEWQYEHESKNLHNLHKHTSNNFLLKFLYHYLVKNVNSDSKVYRCAKVPESETIFCSY